MITASHVNTHNRGFIEECVERPYPHVYGGMARDVLLTYDQAERLIPEVKSYKNTAKDGKRYPREPLDWLCAAPTEVFYYAHFDFVQLTFINYKRN